MRRHDNTGASWVPGARNERQDDLAEINSLLTAAYDVWPNHWFRNDDITVPLPGNSSAPWSQWSTYRAHIRWHASWDGRGWTWSQQIGGMHLRPMQNHTPVYPTWTEAAAAAHTWLADKHLERAATTETIIAATDIPFIVADRQYDCWYCVCGNTDSTSGFALVDDLGREGVFASPFLLACANPSCRLVVHKPGTEHELVTVVGRVVPRSWGRPPAEHPAIEAARAERDVPSDL